MSVIDVIATVKALLQDPALGLAATIEALGASPAALHFVEWKNAGALQPGTSANVIVQPIAWQPELKRQANIRDGVVQFSVSYESFQADAVALEADIAYAATALAQVLDRLRDYSDAHAGTVIDVIDPVGYVFGQFIGGTSAGFTATISLEERSTQ